MFSDNNGIKLEKNNKGIWKPLNNGKLNNTPLNISWIKVKIKKHSYT